MAENPLIRKLRLQPDMRAAFIHAPEGYVPGLGPLPEGVTVTESLDAPSDFVQLFALDSDVLARDGRAAIDAVKPDGLLWICYPKLSSGVKSDLTRDAGWGVIDEAGWRGVANVAIDETWSALRFRPEESKTEADALAAQYAGAKAALRPIYERIAAIVRNFGDDVGLQTRKTYVAFTRGKQFAAVQPSTNTRVDVGLKLPGETSGGRLQSTTNTGGGSMTHKIAVTSVEEVDDELIAFLRAAYERG
jgi:predicted transport protein